MKSGREVQVLRVDKNNLSHRLCDIFPLSSVCLTVQMAQSHGFVFLSSILTYLSTHLPLFEHTYQPSCCLDTDEVSFLSYLDMAVVMTEWLTSTAVRSLVQLPRST